VLRETMDLVDTFLWCGTMLILNVDDDTLSIDLYQ
jgi:hypothetical protein